MVAVTEPGRTPLHLVVRRPVEIGRDCDGLLLADPALSRRHLRLTADVGRLLVTDLDSTNGTRVDGAELRGPTEVVAGQSVIFGACRLELVAPAPERPVTGDPLRRTSIDIVADSVAAEPMTSSPFGGGTLTILFTDIEESTRRTEALGDAAWLRLLALHNSIVRRQMERHGGHEVKAQGDGFMLAFPSARAAVLFAIDLQRALDAHGRSRPTDLLRVRIGMHTGEAILEDGDLFGHAVVLAARIGAQAGGGEILVSSLVREIVESRGDLRFGEERVVVLKGLTGAHRLHPVAWAPDDA